MIKKLKLASLLAAGCLLSSPSFAFSTAGLAPCQMGQILTFTGMAFIPKCVGVPISSIAGGLMGSLTSAAKDAATGAVAGALTSAASGDQSAQPGDPCKGGSAAGGLCPADWNGATDFSKVVGNGGMRFQTVSCDDWNKTHPMVNPENGPFPVNDRSGFSENPDKIVNGWLEMQLSYTDIAGYPITVNGAAVLRYPVLKNSDGTEIDGTPTVLAMGQCDKLVNPTPQSPGGACAAKPDGTFAVGRNCSLGI